jgi:hypothetical protein
MNITDNNFFKFFNSAKRLQEKVKRANSIQHSGGKISPQDWSELYKLQNEFAANLEIIENEVKGKLND